MHNFGIFPTKLLPQNGATVRSVPEFGGQHSKIVHRASQGMYLALYKILEFSPQNFSPKMGSLCGQYVIFADFPTFFSLHRATGRSFQPIFNIFGILEPSSHWEELFFSGIFKIIFFKKYLKILKKN